MIKWLLGALLLAASPALAQNQGQIVPSGSFTPGHTVRCQNSTCTVAVDGGGSAGSNKNGQGYLTEIGITNTGTPFCINDALINAAGGYHQLCLGASALGGGLISFNANGGASPLGLNINVNGVSYPFPGAGNGNVVGPTSPSPTANNVVVWNGGTTVADSKIMAINSTTTGGGPNGNATILGTPPLGLVSATDHTIGLNVVPVISSASATSDFLGGLEVQMGLVGTPIPAGTKGMPAAIVANIVSNQALADQQSQNNGAAFAATVITSNGAWMDGLDMDIELTGSPARNDGIAIFMNNNTTAGSGPVIGLNIAAGGAKANDTAIHIQDSVTNGSWNVGIQNDFIEQIGPRENIDNAWLRVYTPNTSTNRTAMFWQAVGSPTSTQDVVLITAFSGAVGPPDFNLLRIEDANANTPGSGTLEFAVQAGGEITTHLPASAGGGGLFVCVDSAGLLYKKATCP